MGDCESYTDGTGGARDREKSGMRAFKCSTGNASTTVSGCICALKTNGVASSPWPAAHIHEHSALAWVVALWCAWCVACGTVWLYTRPLRKSRHTASPMATDRRRARLIAAILVVRHLECQDRPREEMRVNQKKDGLSRWAFSFDSVCNCCILTRPLQIIV